MSETATLAKRLSKAQRDVLMELELERPRLLSHRQSVSTLAMERIQLRPFIFAQLTVHSYARGANPLESMPTGRLTQLGAQVKAHLLPTPSPEAEG